MASRAVWPIRRLKSPLSMTGSGKLSVVPLTLGTPSSLNPPFDILEILGAHCALAAGLFEATAKAQRTRRHGRYRMDSIWIGMFLVIVLVWPAATAALILLWRRTSIRKMESALTELQNEL